VARRIDPNDLIDAAGVAELLGLASRSVVSVYRGRYSDFPPPAVERGQCRLWLRSDIEAWANATGRATDD
jgi:hypothetical protein